MSLVYGAGFLLRAGTHVDQRATDLMGIAAMVAKDPDALERDGAGGIEYPAVRPVTGHTAAGDRDAPLRLHVQPLGRAYYCRR